MCPGDASAPADAATDGGGKATAAAPAAGAAGAADDAQLAETTTTLPPTDGGDDDETPTSAQPPMVRRRDRRCPTFLRSLQAASHDGGGSGPADGRAFGTELPVTAAQDSSPAQATDESVIAIAMPIHTVEATAPATPPAPAADSRRAEGAPTTPTRETPEASKTNGVGAAAVCSSFHQSFDLVQKLGMGGFGSIFTARRTSGRGGGQQVAVKVADLRLPDGSTDRKKKRAFDTEVRVLRHLARRDAVVDLLGHYLEDGLAYVVLELCLAGVVQAFERMASVTERTMQLILRGMLLGLDACHSARVVHRDVKADNFLVATDDSELGFQVKICDFGLAGALSAPDAQELAGVCGTPPFMAPEMLREARYGAGIDVWALGTLAYVLLYGMWPYVPEALTATAVKAAIVAGTPEPTYEGRPGLPKISDRATSWVRALLERDPGKRPSAQAALHHTNFETPWDASPASCLLPAIAAAKRCGAFDVAQADTRPTALDLHLADLVSRRHVVAFDDRHRNIKGHGRNASTGSSVPSTDVGSDAAASSPSH